MIGAIIITERAKGEQARSCAGALPIPWACIDVLGKPAVTRFAEHLRQQGCDAVSVIGNDPAVIGIAKGSTDYWVNAERLLANYNQEGFETVLIARCGAYVELDLAEMLTFHHDHAEPITRAVASDGPLDLWMIDPPRLSEREAILCALRAANSVPFQLPGYVNPLQTAGDFRRMVLDAFSSRCRLRPQGSEIKPGFWIGDGAQIERAARVVAPAFIGKDVRIADECLITRCSNIESHSQVDYGTAIEDSSILSNTYVGIGLDLSHSVADGSNLLNLQHNVTLEITDPGVMRPNGIRGGNRQLGVGIERRRAVLSSAE